jgi:hypothetical protein
MAYREVTMLEVKEVLRLWLGGGNYANAKGALRCLRSHLGPSLDDVRRL